MLVREAQAVMAQSQAVPVLAQSQAAEAALAQPLQARGAATVHAALAQAQKKYDALLASLVASPAALSELGRDFTELLERFGRAQVLEPGEGPPILTAPQQAELLALAAGGGAKAAIAQYMAPHLRALRLPGAGGAEPLAMVSSEPHLWRASVLGVQRLTLAPDLFLAWAPFVEVQGELRGFPRGGLASQGLQSVCVAELYEARGQALDLEALGQQALHHSCVSGLLKSVLFSHEDCWLLETLHGSPLRQLKMRWTTPGSAGALQRVRGAPEAPPAVALLQRVLAALELAPLGLAAWRCHLGSGGSGHVFAVHRAGDAARAPLALKLVPSCGEGELRAEFERLQEAAAAGAPVVPPVPGSLCLYPGQYTDSGGYLLARVGAPFAVDTEGGVRRAFGALAELHACGVFHGDARIPNLLEVEGRAQWIDPRSECVEGGGAGAAALALEQQQRDAASLAQSMLHRLKAIPAPVHEALELYDSADPAAVAALAGAVWRALRL